MKNRFSKQMSMGILLCSMVVVAGCCVQIGGCPILAQYQRMVQLSAPLEEGCLLEAKTHNGSIIIEGADVTECSLTATIIAGAATETEAKELAERTQVKLDRLGNKLVVKIEKPTPLVNRSIKVSLKATVPNRTNLQLTTHNGAVNITEITGDVAATTHNGKMTLMKLTGAANLQTHNGSIKCEEIAGNAKLRTHNGKISVYYVQTAPAVCNVSAVTHNGGIEFTAPPNLSAQVDISTHNGSIKTDLPISVVGKINKRKLKGTIGTAQGKLHLETHNGSIDIR
jgi:DUF4097 and DUF4098 domain-containing protein YvlB